MKKNLALVIAFLLIGVHPVRLRAQTLELDYSTYLGGGNADYGYGIAVDSDGCAYVTGETGSSDFPTGNPYQSDRVGVADAFISKLSSEGSALIYSSYLGGSASDTGWSVAVDSANSAYVTGETSSANFPTANPYQAGLAGSYDGFISKLSSTGSSIVFSTYLGGDSTDRGYGIALDQDKGAYITGATWSTDFPTENPYQAGRSGSSVDAFVSKLSSSGSSLIYSTYLGSGLSAYGRGIVIDSANSAYVTGNTGSSGFPVINPYQSTRGGSQDGFVSKFSSSGTSLLYSTYLGGNLSDYGYGIALDSNNYAYVAGYTSSADFPTMNPYQATLAGSRDIFISKFSSSGSALAHSTYLGGSASDYGYGIALTSDNYAYVTGYTLSADFPTVNPYQPSLEGTFSDIIVSKFSSSGSSLFYSTYLGGSSTDEGHGIALDPANRAYLTGLTSSSDFPTKNSYQVGQSGGYDGFVSKLKLITPTSSPTPSGTPTASVTPTSTPTATPSPAPSAILPPPPPPTITPATSVTPITPTPTPGEMPPSWIYDYNGDGTSDIAIFRGTSGLWAVRGVTRVYFGGSTDEPVPGDYDGDRTTDIGIFRPSSGLWALRSVSRIYFGGSADETVPGDYDGGGTWSVGIFRPASGLWAVRGTTRIYFGGSADIPVPGYYDSVGAKEIGIFRGSSGLWAIRGITRTYFGGAGDEPVPGNYDGNGTWSAGIFRPASGLWALRGVTRIYFGSGFDQPVPADYSGNSVDDISIFRDSSGLWATRGITRVYFGTVNDIPVTR